MATNPKEYTDLRTLLDSLEIGALRFYLSGTGLPQGQKYRFLKDMLTKVNNEIWRQQATVAKLGVDIDCPPGYYDCEGCCVPYKCPEIGNLTTKKKAKATKKR